MIEVRDLLKKYGDVTAVAGVSFDVAPGEIFAFLGPNGAGKTTTIQMLTTLVPPDAGTMRIDGLDPTTQPSAVRQRFGIVFQDPSLDSELTAWENMEIHGVLYHVPRRTRHERIEQLLKLFELWDRRDAYAKTFSGGMRRRLEIARGFLHTPKILFLDEPTSGVDPITRRQFWELIYDAAAAGTTVLVTTHYMDEAEYCDRISIMVDGRIGAMGTPAELKRDFRVSSIDDLFVQLARPSGSSQEIRRSGGQTLQETRRSGDLS